MEPKKELTDEEFAASLKDARTLDEKILDERWDELQKIKEENQKLMEALSDVLQLIDDGYLIRDISKDNDPSWAIKSLPMVLKLAKAAKIRDNQKRP